MSEIDNTIAAVKEEITALEKKLTEAYTELGEKALPELREKDGFKEAAAAIDGIAKEIEEKKEKTEALLIEKRDLEKKERERIAKCTCHSCRMVNPDDAKFCESCGAKLGELPREYCEECGTMNQPGLKFCGECGNKLKEA